MPNTAYTEYNGKRINRFKISLVRSLKDDAGWDSQDIANQVDLDLETVEAILVGKPYGYGRRSAT